MGASQPRNGKLASLFYRMDLIEAYGTGLGKILNCYAGLPIQPSFESVEGAFRVVLPNIHAASTQEEARSVKKSRVEHTSESAPLTASEQKALQAIRQAGQVSRRELESLLGVGTTRTVVLLKRLVELDKVQKIGNGKSSAKLETQFAYVKLAAASLYYGRFGGLTGGLIPTGAKINFGQPFTSRPISLKGFYQYWLNMLQQYQLLEQLLKRVPQYECIIEFFFFRLHHFLTIFQEKELQQ